jgi:hypothetical protein
VGNRAVGKSQRFVEAGDKGGDMEPVHFHNRGL